MDAEVPLLERGLCCPPGRHTGGPATGTDCFCVSGQVRAMWQGPGGSWKGSIWRGNNSTLYLGMARSRLGSPRSESSHPKNRTLVRAQQVPDCLVPTTSIQTFLSSASHPWRQVSAEQPEH